MKCKDCINALKDGDKFFCAIADYEKDVTEQDAPEICKKRGDFAKKDVRTPSFEDLLG